jgi:hypothetical protein
MSSEFGRQDNIMGMVPGDVLLPSNRLEQLLRQSLRYQQTASLYPYTKSTELNLAEDLVFDEFKLPHLCSEIKYHSDEVWVCKFSPSGKWLATAGEVDVLGIPPAIGTRCSCQAILKSPRPTRVECGNSLSLACPFTELGACQKLISRVSMSDAPRGAQAGTGESQFGHAPNFVLTVLIKRRGGRKAVRVMAQIRASVRAFAQLPMGATMTTATRQYASRWAAPWW